MSVKISELPILSSLADNDVIAGVDTSANVTSKIEMATLKNYIDTNTQYTAGTNIDITNNVVSAPNVYNKTETDAMLEEKDEQIEELQSEVDSLSMIYNAFPTESGEGESLTLDDTAEVKFKKFDLKGNTSQTTYSGKNLLNLPNGSKTSNGITSTITNGKLKIVGTTTANWFSICGLNIPLESGTYTFSYTNKKVFRYNLSLRYEDNTTGTIYGNTDRNTPITLSQKATIISMSSDSNTVGTNFDYEDYLMLEAGSSATSYEPFVGGTTSPNPSYPQPVNVVSGDNEISVVGKNLFDITQTPVVINTHYDSSGTIQVWNNYVGIREYVEVSSNTTYVQSNNLGLGITRVCFYDNAKTFLSAVTANSFTTPNNAKYIRFSIYSEGNVLPTWLQIEKGSTATTYEPYQGNTYNIDLPVENLLPYPYSQTTKTTNGITFTDLGDGTIKINGTATANASLTLFASYQNQGTIPGNYVSGGLSSNVRVRVINYSGDSYHILGVSEGTSVAIDKSTYTQCYIELTVMSGATVNNLIVKPMITNIKANNYTPYGTTPIELCKIGNYQDYFYKDSGKWYLHKEIGKVIIDENIVGGALTDSNQRIMFSSSSNPFLSNVYIPTPSSVSNLTPSLSNYFSSSAQSEITPTNNKVGFSKWGDTTFVYFSAIYNSVEEFKTWLSTHNVVVYYVLATTTTIEVEYQPLIDQLNLLEKAMSKDGQTNISQVNNDLPFIISASALKEWQESTSLNSTLSMVNPLSLGNTLNTQEIDLQPIEVDNIEPLEEEENEES